MILHESNKQGYILILTFLILSMSVLLVTQFYRRGTIHMYFDSTIVAREKAKMLALSGLQLALSQLYVEEKKQDNQKQQTASSNETQAQAQMLKNLLPIVNLWQAFELKEDVDGMDGIIKICLVSEDGKININELFDFQKGAVKPDMKQSAQFIFNRLGKDTKTKNLLDLITALVKKRKRPFDDVTQLLAIDAIAKQFQGAVFYQPPEKKADKVQKRPLFLTDLFTVWSGSEKIQPWLLSDSVAGLLQMQRASVQDHQARVSILKGFGKKPLPTGSVEKIWKDLLQKIYKKPFKSLSKDVQGLFSSNFSPNAFSVVSYGIVRNTVQKVIAVVKKKKKSSGTLFAIKKLYWI